MTADNLSQAFAAKLQLQTHDGRFGMTIENPAPTRGRLL